MRRTAVLLVIALMVISMLAAVTFAQQPRQKKQPSKAQSEQKQASPRQMAARLARQMKLNEDEEAAVMPKVQDLIILKLKGTSKPLQDLRKIQKNESASDVEISAALAKFREDLASARRKIAEAELELIGAPEMTPKRQLVLTFAGVLDNGTGLRRATVGRETKKESGSQGQPQKKGARPGGSR